MTRRPSAMLPLLLVVACERLPNENSKPAGGLFPGSGPAAAPAAAEPLKVLTLSLPGGQVGQPYDLQNKTGLVATGGIRPITWAVTKGQLPAGLTLNPKTGDITGTPRTKTSESGIEFTVTDDVGNQAKSRLMTITIDDPRFLVFILGKNKLVPEPQDRSGERDTTVTLRVRYIKNDKPVEKIVMLTLPKGSTPVELLEAMLPALQKALGDDFVLTLETGAASPRIDIAAKAGVTLGRFQPNLGGSAPRFVYEVKTGKLRVGVSLANLAAPADQR